MILRSRFVLPVSQPPIHDGAVVVSGDRVVAAGPWLNIRRDHSGEVSDLGDAVIMPGLVNGHCHLDYTDMAGLSPVRRSFSEWIKCIVSLKATWTEFDYARSWARGAEMMVRSGTTAVVDIEAVPALLPGVARATPLRVLSCHEIISLKRGSDELLEEAIARLDMWENERKGLSPHAPYTTTASLLTKAAALVHARDWLLTSHVAESDEEFEMFTAARGAMHEWLRPQRDMSDCGVRTPVQHMEAAGALADSLVVHANYVTAEDIQLLAHRGAHVVHCPRSHDYFGHREFPFQAMRGAGINICLGTDSLASVHAHSRDGLELSVFSEMRAFACAFPGVSPEEIVRMSTINPAAALRQRGKIGELCPGGCADLIVIPATGTTDPYDAVLHHRGGVTASMIRGEWVSI